MKSSGPFVTDLRFKQANREAVWAVGLALLNLLWWYCTAYGFGSKTPENYIYILGLPLWFMLSCVGGLVLFSLFSWVMVRLFFCDMVLDAYLPETEEEEQR